MRHALIHGAVRGSRVCSVMCSVAFSGLALRAERFRAVRRVRAARPSLVTGLVTLVQHLSFRVS